MHQKSILTLEYPKILERVAKEAAFSASKELVMELEPTPDISAARRRLAYTTEAHQLLELYNNMSVQGARDIRAVLCMLGGCWRSSTRRGFHCCKAWARISRNGRTLPGVSRRLSARRARCWTRPVLPCASCASISAEPTSVYRIV